MKNNIAVIFGGRSAEADISIITAHTPIIQSLLTMPEYEVWPVYITREGDWYCDKAFNNFSFFQADGFRDKVRSMKKVGLLFDNGLKLVWPGFGGKSIKIDLVFTAMHGTYGEDGSLMGVLRMANVPFIGCDIFASAVAMDKVLTKQVASSEGLAVVPYVWFTKHDWETNTEELKKKISALKWPLFVKPVHLGSSIAISKVKTPEELINAIEVALHYDNKVLVEEGVENLIELTLPIMGNETLQLAGLEQPMNKTEFFNFEDKYLGGTKKGSGMHSQYSQIPALIEPELAEKAKAIAQKTYKALGCEGIARVDMLLDKDTNEIYINEVNTLPGSLYHHNWRAVGVSGQEVVQRLIELAQERFAIQSKTTQTFDSEVLKNVGGGKTGQ